MLGANAAFHSHFGFWSLNAARIVYLIEEDGPCEKHGFAYGTLPEHGERGEERWRRKRLVRLVRFLPA